MNTKTNYNLYSATAQKADQFEPIYLAEMDNVKLMNRTDVKYIIPADRFLEILEVLQPYYKCLEVNENRLCDYKTLYFDTPDLQLYHDHLRGRLNRYKIRRRCYVQSDTSFLEVKFKNNKGRTIKKRIRQPFFPFISQYDESGDFLVEKTPFNPEEMNPVLWVNYTRITLVHRYAAERITLDLNLQFQTDKEEKNYTKIIIAEVKQECLQSSIFMDLMKYHQIRRGGMSKYCLGMISLYQPLRCNRFKPSLLQLQKIMTQ